MILNPHEPISLENLSLEEEVNRLYEILTELYMHETEDFLYKQ